MPPMPSPNTGRLKKVENLPSNQNCTVIPDTLPATVYFGAVEVRNWMIVGAEQVQTYPLPALKLTNGVKSVLHRDALGSVRAITDAAGVKVESAVYKPFGEQTEWLSAAQTAPETKAGIPAEELQTHIELTESHATFRALSFTETHRTAHRGHTVPTSITYRRQA